VFLQRRSVANDVTIQLRIYSNKLSKGMGYRSTVGIVSTMLKLSSWSQLLLDDELTFNQAVL